MTKRHSKTNLHRKTGKYSKRPKLSNKKNLNPPPNHNPLIASDGIDTLSNVYAIMQFLQDCDLLSDNTDYRFQPRSGDGLYFIGEVALQVLRFEISCQQSIHS